MNTNKSAIQLIANATKIPVMTPHQIKQMMERLDMNDRAFALLMNVTPMTVRMWLTGASQPCSVARRLMQIYSIAPEIVEKLTVGLEESEL